jgi:hypothetical protein
VAAIFRPLAHGSCGEQVWGQEWEGSWKEKEEEEEEEEEVTLWHQMSWGGRINIDRQNALF